jgi:isopentenyl phosphate kinase
MALPLEAIDPALLVTVHGGEMQWHPALAGTLDAVSRRKRGNKPDPRMQQAVTAIGTAMSSLTSSVAQTNQQSSQAMMQMLPQMMRR